MGNCFRTIMSHVLSSSERFAICISFTCILSCAVLCMMCMLAFGIGLGYNYSYVDYRAKHNYVKGAMKKVRPTNYYGPGYYKPTTRLKKRPKKKGYYMRERVPGAPGAPALPLDPGAPYDYESETPQGLPYNPPDDLIKNELNPPPFMNIETRKSVPIEQFYFNKVTTKPRLLTVSLNDSTTEMIEMTTDLNTETEVYMHARRLEEGDAFNESDVNATNYLSDQEEAVTVNVTKTHNNTEPFIIKTMMHPNHLSKWLSRLRQANKTFAVHVITN